MGASIIPRFFFKDVCGRASFVFYEHEVGLKQAFFAPEKKVLCVVAFVISESAKSHVPGCVVVGILLSMCSALSVACNNVYAILYSS